MAASTTHAEPLAVIDTSFISRTILGTAGINVLRGVIWGNVAALSQALGAPRCGGVAWRWWAPAAAAALRGAGCN